MKFSDRSLSKLALKPGQKDRIAFDDECPGLGVRLTAKGTRTFIAQWTDAATKQRVREPLGVWGSITIDQARAAARVKLGDVAKGINPRAERVARKAAHDADRASDALTLDALISEWAARHLAQRRPRYAEEAPRALRLAFADHLRRPAAKLSRAEVIAVLDPLSASGRGTAADRTKACGRACYAWAFKREKVPGNPFADLPMAGAVSDRDRVLTDAEIAEVDTAAAAMPYPWGPFYRSALRTLQRRDEVAGMRWSELAPDGSLWTIPGARMKNGKPHDVHLVETVRRIFATIPRLAKRDLVFTTTGKTPISGFSDAKAALDAMIVKARAKAAGEAGLEPEPLTPWRLHDFRRTGVSTMAALGIDSIVADKILAHKPAKLKGVAAVYQRHQFAKERRIALEAWAAHVEGIGAARSNVVPMRKA